MVGKLRNGHLPNFPRTNRRLHLPKRNSVRRGGHQNVQLRRKSSRLLPRSNIRSARRPKVRRAQIGRDLPFFHLLRHIRSTKIRRRTLVHLRNRPNLIRIRYRKTLRNRCMLGLLIPIPNRQVTFRILHMTNGKGRNTTVLSRFPPLNVNRGVLLRNRPNGSVNDESATHLGHRVRRFLSTVL